MASLGTAQGNIVISTAQFQQAVQQVQQGSAQMNKALAAIGVGLTFAGIERLAQAGYDLAKSASQVDLARDSFKTLAAQAGESADAMLDAMRKASRGMISDSNLILNANRALLSGVAQNSNQISQLLEVARVRGQAVGKDLAASFDDLINGLARNSPKVLDNLLIFGTQKALDDYAASIGTTAAQLSDAQQKAILFNAVIASTQPLLDADSKSTGNANQKIQTFETTLDNAKQRLGEMLLQAGETDTLDTFDTAIGKSIDQLETLIDTLEKLSQSDAISSLAEAWNALNTPPKWWTEGLGHEGFRLGNFLEEHTGTRFGLRTDDPTAQSGPGSGGGGGGSGGFGTNPASGPMQVPATPIDWDAVTKAQVDHNQKLADITRDTNRQIQQATESAGHQRAETVRSYELGIVREEQDFGIQRARQERDFQQDITRMLRDEGQRDAKIQADLNENIAQQRADHNKQLARQEEDFQTQRLRALKDHNDDLMDAAGRLDAAAVYKSQRDFAKQEQQADEDHTKQLKRDAEDQAEREDQERKAAQKQLDEAHQADEQRLQDMRDAFAQQKTDEDADRTLRQARAAEDYQHQLEEQDYQAGLRIQQIQENAADERTAQQDAFDQQLEDLHLHNQKYHEKQIQLQQQAIEDLKPLMKDWFATQAEAMKAAMAGLPIQGPATRWPSLRDPASFVPRSATTSSVNTNNSRSVTVGNVTISLGDVGGRTDEQIKRLVYDGIVEALEGVAP